MSDRIERPLRFMGNTSLITHLPKGQLSRPRGASIVDRGLVSMPWGTTHDMLSGSFRQIHFLNLENSLGRLHSPEPSPMTMLDELRDVNIRFANLANPYVFRYDQASITRTFKELADTHFTYPGGMHFTKDYADKPALIDIPAWPNTHILQVWSATDCVSESFGESKRETVHTIDYTASTRDRLKALLDTQGDLKYEVYQLPMIKIFSANWGPEYSWEPSSNIRDLAHFLIDECGIDIVWGHNPRHVQGVEKYKGKLIMYGCGNFLKEPYDGSFRLFEEFREFKAQLGAIWEVTLGGDGEENMSVEKLTVIPTFTVREHVRLLDRREPEARWVCEKVKELSLKMNTDVHIDEEEMRVTLDLDIKFVDPPVHVVDVDEKEVKKVTLDSGSGGPSVDQPASAPVEPKKRGWRRLIR